MRKAGGQHYYCLERNPEFAAVVSSLVDLAGLSDLVKVFVGASGDSLRRLNAEGKLSQIDLLFLDHYKPAYVVDLKLCEQLKMVGPGSVLAADNVIKPGNPPYLKYVRSSVEEKRQAGDEAIDTGSFFPETTAKQYLKREGEEQLDLKIVGDPNLVYKSEIVHSYEPTGVPVSRHDIPIRCPLPSCAPFLTLFLDRMVLRFHAVSGERLKYNRRNERTEA